MRYIFEYLNEIEKGRIAVSKAVETQYKRLIPILDGKHERYAYNDSKGHRPIEFGEMFCTPPDAYEKLKLMLFQKAKFEAVFGIVNRETGFRKHKQVFDLRARKNGKSIENSVTGLYLTGCDGEKAAQVYSAAGALEQAKRVWLPALQMIKQSKELQTKFKALESKNIIEFTPNFSRYMPMSKNYKLLEGANVHGAIIDELHILTREIYDVILLGTSRQNEPLINMITTQGTEFSGLLKDKYEQAKKIIEGTFENDEIFCLLYELDELDDWQDQNVWQKPNPALDIIKPLSGLISNYKNGLSDKKGMAEFKTKDLNMIVGNHKAWIPAHFIVNNEKTFETRTCTSAIGGLDLSISNDLTCFTILTYNKQKDEFEADTMYWIPECRLEIKDELTIQYKHWIEQGYLRLSGTDIINYADIAKYIYDKAVNQQIIFNWIYYDPYSAAHLINELKAMGFSDTCLKMCWQTYKNLSTPMQMLEADVKSQKINFKNNPITKWCFTNVSIKTKKGSELGDEMGNILPEKNGGRNRKIDGMATILNCYVGLNEHLREFTQL